MKKQYINPTTKTVKVKLQYHMLAGSGVSKEGDDLTGIGFGGEYSGSGMKSRSTGSFWDDDEE